MSLTFGEKIKEARKQKNLTQKQLADLIGAAHNSISDWENNKNKPDPDTIELLCGALKITPNYLLASTEDYFSPKEKLLIKKYRFISTHSPDGASVVDTVLDREYAIAEKLREQKEQLEKVQKIDMEVAEELVPTRIIAYYQRLASAGSGDYLFDDLPTDFIEVRETEIAKKADFVIGVDGKSMEPDYMDGEKVFVRKDSEISFGEVGIFINDNDCFIKEFGKDCLISRNKSYPDVIPKNGTRLVGKVIGKVEE